MDKAGEGKVAYIYIVECEDTSLYTGITKDICKRMKTHTSAKGAAARYTKSHKIKSLRALWYCDDYKVAAKLEYAIKKRLSRQEKLCLIENPSVLNELLLDFEEYEFQYVEGVTLEMCLENTQKAFVQVII